ncbi:MAG TPA: ATP-binding protein [Myxococcota bacterium]|jgi:signal transduction histidine kinase|nr:ATP-binding protein [Myxococcota bacterium]
MDIQTQTSLLAAIITLALAISAVLRTRAHRLQLRFAALNLTLFVWHATTFVMHAAGDVGPWRRVALFAVSALPVALSWFFIPFVGETNSEVRVRRGLILLPSIAFAIAVATPLYRSRVLAGLGILLVFGSVAFCLFSLWRRADTAGSRREALRLKYLFWGGTVTALLVLTDFLPNIGVVSPSIGNVFEIVYLYFVSQALLLYRLLDLEELLGKGVVLAILSILLATMYAVLTFWVPSGSALFFFNTVVASFVILILFDPVRLRVETAVNRILFSEKFHLSQDLQRLRRDLARTVDVSTGVRAILHTLEESRRVSHAAVYVPSDDGSTFVLGGAVGPPPPERLEVLAVRPFHDRLRSGGPLSAEDVARERRTAAQRRRRGTPTGIEAIALVETTMKTLNASVVIPFAADGRVLGFMALGDDRVKEAYSEAEQGMLVEVATQATIAIQNSESVRRIRERDRLAALGEMAAGLAHEIKNPLSAIKGAAQLVSTSGEGLSADEGEFLDIIVEEVNRLDSVVSQFLDYARPYGRKVEEPVDVAGVVRRTVSILERAAMAEALAIELDLADGLPPVPGDAEQLRQVFLNLALNAKEAVAETGRRGRLRISTRLWQRAGTPPAVEVAFTDDGPGIDPSQLEKMFVPFHTTKEGGTGLGLPISQRIVEHHGGRIIVESTPGKGATFTVRLPARPGMEPAAPSAPGVKGAAKQAAA